MVQYRAFVAVISLFLGCTPAPSKADKPSERPPTNRTVIVVGDQTAKALVEQLRGKSVHVLSDLDSKDGVALIVILQDAMNGPMPVHREIVERIAKRADNRLLWVMTNSDKIDDRELLELEELESRELLNKYGLPGDTAQFAFDSVKAVVSPSYVCPTGWNAIVQYIVDGDG